MVWKIYPHNINEVVGNSVFKFFCVQIFLGSTLQAGISSTSNMTWEHLVKNKKLRKVPEVQKKSDLS